MRQINLLPRELAAGRRDRQILGVVVASAGAVLALLIIYFIAQQARLTSERNKLAQLQRQQTQLQAQVDQLSQFSDSQTTLNQRIALLAALTKNEVLWSHILTEVSLVIPSDDWLTQFTGQSLAAVTTASGQPPGTITVAGCTLIPPDGPHLNVAAFLVQIAKPLIFTDSPFLTLSSRQDSASTCPVQFNAQITLSTQSTRTAQGQDRKV